MSTDESLHRGGKMLKRVISVLAGAIAVGAAVFLSQPLRGITFGVGLTWLIF